MTDLNEYPAGIRDLLGWAKFHLEQLDLLEREFRVWQETQADEAAPCTEILLLLGTPSRLRWETMARAVAARE